MLSAIRKRMTYANVAVTLALVFAMSGGAYAAGRYVITSTKQISPKVLKLLEGKNGAVGPAGPAGSQGPQGATGAKGETGAAGANGRDGTNGTSVTSKEVKAGETACAGNGGSEFVVGTSKTTACNGTTGYTETLPPGKTETGSWVATPRAEGELVSVPISFNIPLAAPIASESASKGPNGEHAFHVPSTGQGPECPGTAAEPKAAAGDLCVYEGVVANASLTNPLKVTGFDETGASTAGAYFTVEGGASSPRLAFGTWAVTAPE
jgi:hypothetical protein